MTYRFGLFEFDSVSGELHKSGRRVPLEPQPARVLALLLARAGTVVSRDEVKEAAWSSDIHVDFDRGLAYCLSHIRTALGDSAQNPRFVQTLPKRGYRFIAPVESPSEAPALPTVGAEAPGGARQRAGGGTRGALSGRTRRRRSPAGHGTARCARP